MGTEKRVVHEFGWLTISAVLTGLAFAPVGWRWTLLFAPALWLAWLRGGAGWQNAWRGFWWMLVYGATVSWHASPIFAQQAHAEWLGGIAWALALLWFGLWGALFGGLISVLRLQGWRWVLVVASLWTGVQWARSLGALGFPWAMLALGLAKTPLLMQPAELGGVWLVEWLLIVWNGGLVLVCQKQSRVAIWGLGSIGVLWVGFSAWSLGRYRDATEMQMPVAVVQHQAETPLKVFAPAIFDEQVSQWLQQASQRGARWAVFPEVAEPYTLTETAGGTASKRLHRWRQWAEHHRLSLLMGASRFDGKDYNSALGFAPCGAFACYDKVKLMAFVEWSPPEPFARWLRGLGVAKRSLQRGEQVRALRLGQEPPVGTLLCVESLFGWVAREQVRTGAQWLTVMANDQWLIGDAVRQQYADFCVVRAIETRRWIARASSVGISGFYAPTGELVASLPMSKPGVLVYPIVPCTDQTMYVRWGDWWVYLCLAIVGVSSLRRLARGILEEWG